MAKFLGTMKKFLVEEDRKIRVKGIEKLQSEIETNTEAHKPKENTSTVTEQRGILAEFYCLTIFM